MKCRFAHYNFNIKDLDKSIEFYGKALGLKPKQRKEAEDGSFVLMFLGDGQSDFLLELTWLRDWKGSYNLGDNEMHLAVYAAGDYDKVREFHREMGCICYENESMGVYFITDPDGYWIEILRDN
ncbi:MAG: VOC family protein [Clostridiales bacterium]|nr:VOC family protein [Clostridiales bacterium]